MKILVVEDEPEMLDVVVRSLERESAVVEIAPDFNTALDKIAIYDYDCILLDINLPGGSGLELLEELKKMSKTDGVLIMSARDSLDDRLMGLNLGADDYLTKPFHLSELVARVKSIVRRKKFDGKQTIVIGNLNINPEDRIVTSGSEDLQLNRKEFAILMYCISNKDRLIHKTALAEHVWGDHVDESDNFEFIYSQIKNLRKKLKDANAGVEIQSVYGIGYKFTVE
jgi:two-component system, OmpR family, response regulator ArlR